MKITDVLKKQKEFFNTNATKDIAFRKAQLLKLKHMILMNEDAISNALLLDLNKSAFETYATEISIVLAEINTALKNVKKWSKPVRKLTPIHLIGSSAYTLKEPYGVVLILSPWNYPIQLALAPLVGCIAAGNTAILKCSKSCANTSRLLFTLINETFDNNVIYCIDESTEYEEILNCSYNYIFFTGSERVGKIIMKSASQYLTPVSLELGGKSPVFISADADLNMASKRIIWAKSLNSGQTCVAPDYVLIDKKVKDEFISKCEEQITKMFPNGINEENYPKIINNFHFQRLVDLIKVHDGNVVANAETSQVFLTLLPNCTWDSDIMKEEIFGPILPIIEYEDVSDAIASVKSRSKPLATYIFSKNTSYSQRILREVSFGGGCVNDCVMHLSNHYLPFGGVGGSGMGQYHGHYSFDTFSHVKAIQNNTHLFDLPLRYPRYSAKGLKCIKKIIK